MTAISTKNLNISYGNLDIVKDLNLEIPKGKITTIIGANGCGKSTILKTIARIITPKSGEKNKDAKNNIPATTLERPVLAPALLSYHNLNTKLVFGTHWYDLRIQE